MEPPAAAVSPDPPPHDHSPAASPAKRSAWKHPSSNGSVDAAAVMDADHWPALSESAKAKPSPPSDSPKPSELSPAAPSPGATSSSNSIKHSPTSSYSQTSVPHHGRQKPAKRGGGGGGGSEHSPRDHPERNAGGWDHSGGGSGRSGQRGHNNGGGRRGNGNNGAGGGVGAAHHGGFAGRRRGGGGFEGFYRGPMGMGPYMRGAPPPPPPLAVAPPFIGPPPPPVMPVRGFAGPMVFHEMPSPVSPVSPLYYVGPPPPPEALRGMTAFAPPPMVGPSAYPYIQPPPDADRAKLLYQIEFYFSKDNLCTDLYLREKMDEQGWVDISLIAGFNKVKAITDSIQYIKETLHDSSTLEIQGDKIRRRNDWGKWVIPRESNPDIPLGPLTLPDGDVNDLAVHVGSLGLHASASSGSTVNKNHDVANGSISGNSNNQAPADEGHTDHH